MKFPIKSRWDSSIIFEAEIGSLKACVELAIKNKINLRGADLSGAKIDDLMCINDLRDAIDLAPLIFSEWKNNGLESTKKRFGMFKISGENRALILMCPLFVGGYCFVLEKKEIWWWNWSCPNPNNVPVLWKEND